MLVEQSDRLLSLLNVQLRSLATVGIASGTGLQLPASADIKVLFILKGRGILKDGEDYREGVGKATIVFLPPGRAFSLTEGSARGSILSWEEVAVTYGEMTIASTDGSAEPALRGICVMVSSKSLSIRLFHNLRQAITEDLSDLPMARTAFDTMLCELRHPRFGTKTVVEALMMQCYVLALRKRMERSEKASVPIKGLCDPHLGEALLKMIDHPEIDHCVESLARDCGMSRTVFADRFSRAFSQSPMNMLKEIRMSSAASLLKTTSLPIDSIAASVGYGSRSYFSRAFKKSFGMDPRSFRQRTQAQLKALEETL